MFTITFSLASLLSFLSASLYLYIFALVTFYIISNSLLLWFSINDLIYALPFSIYTWVHINGSKVPTESSMAEMAVYGLPDFWPCKRKQTQSLRSPIRNISFCWYFINSLSLLFQTHVSKFSIEYLSLIKASFWCILYTKFFRRHSSPFNYITYKKSHWSVKAAFLPFPQ